MTNKDWLLLTIPIISNGLLLFIFQFYFNRFYKRKDEIRKERNIGINNKIETLENLQKHLFLITHRLDPSELSSLLNKCDEYIKEFKRIIDIDNNLNLIDQEKNENLFRDWAQLSREISIYKLTKGNYIKPEDKEPFEKLLRDLYNNSSELIKDYKKILST